MLWVRMLSFSRAVITWCIDLLKVILTTFWDIAEDFLCWFFDVCFSVAQTMLELFVVQAASNWYQELDSSLNGMPSEVLSVFHDVGLDYSVGIIMSAYAMRFVMQIIPFVRWGS